MTCRDQFIDLCILLGCDYLDPIPKVGPNTALKLIREHGSLKAVVEKIKGGTLKFTLPPDYADHFEDARELFIHPEVRAADHPDCDFKWEAPDVEGLVQFLVHEKGFSEDRVRSGASRLSKGSKTQQQSRLEGFFKPKDKTEDDVKNLKRKHDEKLQEQKKKQKQATKEKKESKAKPRGTV